MRINLIGLGLCLAMFGLASLPTSAQIHDDAPRPAADPAWFANPTPVKMSGKPLPTCNGVTGDEDRAKKPCLDVDANWANESRWKGNEKKYIYIGWLFPTPLAPAYAGDTEVLDVIKTNTVGSDNIGNSRANRYIAAHRYDLAMQQLNHVLKVWPSSYGAYARRGEIYRYFGKHDLAKADFDAALYWLDHSPVKDPYKGRHYEAQENLANALNYLNLRRAEYYIQEGKAAEAKAALDRVKTYDYTAKFYQPYQQKLLGLIGVVNSGLAFAQTTEVDRLLQRDLNCGEDPAVYDLAAKARYRAVEIGLAYARMFRDCGLKELSIPVFEPHVLAALNDGGDPAKIDEWYLMLLMEYYVAEGRPVELVSQFKTAAAIESAPMEHRITNVNLVWKLYEKIKQYSSAIEYLDDVMGKGDDLAHFVRTRNEKGRMNSVIIYLASGAKINDKPLSPLAEIVVQRMSGNILTAEAREKEAALALQRQNDENNRRIEEENQRRYAREAAEIAAASRPSSDWRLAQLEECNARYPQVKENWQIFQEDCEFKRSDAVQFGPSIYKDRYFQFVFVWER